ncbi:MAG: Fe-S cluster assembly protein SufD, partial [Limnobacter sp.]|nr:Fe-S cluster assembly protein SufD [Limnobacter sp.]
QAPRLPGAGLPWLAERRREAIERFAELGWPSSKLEDWRHTSLLFLGDADFAPPAWGQRSVDDAIRATVAGLRADDENGHWLVFVDGRFEPSLSRVGALPAGAEVAALSELLDRAPDWLEASFGDAAAEQAPQALNAAFAADGAVVRLAPGVAVDESINLVFIAASGGAASHPRNFVVAGAGAQATIVEHYPGIGAQPDTGTQAASATAAGAADGGAATLTNVVTRIEVHADARITHLKLQQEHPEAIHLAAIDAVQGRGSSFASHSMSFGARLARNDITTRFDGEACETLFNGLYHVDGKRHVDHHTRIDHAQPRGTSREYYRGILDDAARGVFTGRILVGPGAIRTDAVQRTDSLLLSPRAETDARPELEIYADDVKCAHGATVGQLDEATLFYLRTRGIGETEARNLLTYAFAVEALLRIELLPLRRRAGAAIRARLPGAESMEALR